MDRTSQRERLESTDGEIFHKTKTHNPSLPNVRDARYEDYELRTEMSDAIRGVFVKRTDLSPSPA